MRTAPLFRHLVRSIPLVVLAIAAAPATALAPQAPFGVVDASVPANAIVAINLPIDVRFTAPVDLATVNASTVRFVSRATSAPAVGDYTLIAPDTVRFQPRCPTRLDLSDAGFELATSYDLLVPGGAGVPLTVRSLAGDAVATPFARRFSTQDATLAIADLVGGPPSVVLRNGGSRFATRLELANDSNQRVYFEPRAVSDPALGADVPAGFVAPLNLYSQTRTRVAIVVVLDQMVGLAPENLDPARVRVEYEVGPSSWAPLPREVELSGNCGSVGGALRVRPLGVLPQDRRVRVVLGAGFADAIGEALATDVVVGTFRVGVATDPGTSTIGDAADEVFEGFDTLAVDDRGFDPGAGRTRAVWGVDGKLAHPAFEGTGGPGGDFDWVIDGTVVLDTTFAVITNAQQTQQQTVLNGQVDVRSVWVKPTGILILLGPNPCTILASGTLPSSLPGYPAGTPPTGVLIEGLVRCNGSNNPGVVTFGTSNIPEPGAAGQCGGGTGGTGSFLTTQSTPRGGHAFGAFQAVDRGGRGGESGFNPQSNVNFRKPGGGGGGRFGADQRELTRPACPDQRMIGLDAEDGFDGSPQATGALHPGVPNGGSAGPRPFTDADPTNDFWGTLVAQSGAVITGELLQPWAGAGGGGGGDACLTSSFPTTPFTSFGDEKGAGGGGGGGSLTIRALGDIRVGGLGAAARARIQCNGGTGGGGENTSGIDRVGGGSGGGSGGHLILESRSSIDLSRCTSVSSAINGQVVWGGLFARGGQGGEGDMGTGGARAGGVETLPGVDALPVGSYPTTAPAGPCAVVDLQNDAASTVLGFAVPPQFHFTNVVGNSSPNNPKVCAGGDGGPGIIQLHVPSLANLVLPATTVPPASNASFRDLCFPLPIGATPATANTPSQWNRLAPSFGTQSAARSRWVALGAPEVVPGSASSDDTTFVFDGTDPLDGRVLTTGAVPPFDVLELAPIASGALAAAPELPSIAADGRSLLLDGTLLDDLYRRGPALAKGFLLRVGGQDFEVGAASFAPASGVFRVIVTAGGTPLAGFGPGTSFALVPRFFRAGRGAHPDELYGTGAVRVRFQAARARANGTPDELSASALVGDVAALNTAGAGWRFVRFVVEFETGAQGATSSVPENAPFLDFVRLPFRF